MSAHNTRNTPGSVSSGGSHRLPANQHPLPRPEGRGVKERPGQAGERAAGPAETAQAGGDISGEDDTGPSPVLTLWVLGGCFVVLVSLAFVLGARL
jgi:hypothetical protein